MSEPARQTAFGPSPAGGGGSDPAVALASLSVTFNSDAGVPVHALENVSLGVGQGEFVSILGPSGCGKSTLLRVVADLVDASEGEITVLGGSPRAARTSRTMGFVFQDASLLPWRSALANVNLPLEVSGAPEGRGAEDPQEMLELVGLGGRADALPEELSGGMRQRVAIARALVTRPRILLMDEPFGALDEITRETMNKELLRIWRETGTTVIFVTHSIPEAVFLSQRIAVLTSHPGTLRGVLEVELPDERDYELRDSTEFVAIAAEARALLHGGS